MNATEQIIKECVAQSNSGPEKMDCSINGEVIFTGVITKFQEKKRLALWIHFLQVAEVKTMVEVGVYKGDFAATILKECDSVEKYYMIDPWRHLDNWNKPANRSNDLFEQFLSETESKTEFAAKKRVILRGKTTEVIEKIPDGGIDFAYIDGDHTLRGITIDLINVFPKVRAGGWIGGDDFTRTIWEHPTEFEPTLVFPFAVYFAEAVDARIYALPNAQFLIEKNSTQSFEFIDLTGCYDDISLRDQFRPDKILKLKLRETFPFVTKIAGRAKSLMSK